MRPAAIAALILTVAGGTTAGAGPQFTADAVETEPGREMKYVRMFVGEKGARYEFQVGGQPVVEIVRPGEDKVLTLFPLTRTYAEGTGSPGTSFAELHPAMPCEPSDEAECKMEADVGTANVPASKIERWVIVHKSMPAEDRVWWDAGRKMAVRKEFADGREMQATMRGTMSFDNRTVENWEVLYLSPNGTYRRGISLYAPDLGMAIAEQQPGGVMRELRNIQPGAPDTKLFDVPEGYTRIDLAAPAMPAPPAAPATGGAQGPGQGMAPSGAGAPMPQAGMPMPQAAPPQQSVPFADGFHGPAQQPAAPAANSMYPMAMPPSPQTAPQPQMPMAAQQSQPAVPQAYTSTYGSSWAPRSDPQMGGTGAGGGQSQAAAAAPYLNPPGGPSPAQGAPLNAPSQFAPYPWQMGPAPQFQRPDQQAPATEFGRKP